MRLSIPAVVLALASLLALPVHAQGEVAANPYEGRAAVADQSPASRDSGLREALAQVVDRVSGAGASSSAPAVLARAAQLVQRYGFDTGSGAVELVASFDRNAVDSQLRAAGLPVWGYSAAPAETTELTVRGLRSSADYATVLTALRAVPGVRKIAVLGADGDQLSLTVSAEGGSARLVSVLGKGPPFSREPSAVPGALALRLAR